MLSLNSIHAHAKVQGIHLGEIVSISYEGNIAHTARPEFNFDAYSVQVADEEGYKTHLILALTATPPIEHFGEAVKAKSDLTQLIFESATLSIRDGIDTLIRTGQVTH